MIIQEKIPNRKKAELPKSDKKITLVQYSNGLRLFFNKVYMLQYNQDSYCDSTLRMKMIH
ncbi:hypothetical protein J2S10_003462 [Neobacillus ginsengisoli]|uniref:Helix-turn-helix domain-containing protein n=1 Tax=Neobacillus ginsengisoli TaxID=904295 RepID=A0ABT9XZE6_9BACI|nr:hypothetical protein [Neobacillus ginsengisoli]